MSEQLMERTTGMALLVELERAGALTPVSLDLSDVLSDEQVEGLATMLGTIKRRASWWIGDLLIFAEGTMGEKYAQVAHWTGLNEETLANYVWVCKQVPKSRRRDRVPFSCHAEVAPMSPAMQKRWLALAAKEQLTQRQLRALIRAEQGDQDGAAGSDASPGRRASDEKRVHEVARRIWRTAQSDGNGYYRVSAELFAQLAAALGEED